MANAVVKTDNNAAVMPKGQKQISKWLSEDAVRQKFVDVLDKRADAFISSLVALVNESPELANIDKPATIMTAALQAATLKLPINKNLGFAYIIPYKKSKKVGDKWVQESQAQFQMGWKGYVQLAERTGQYETIHAGVVCEGQVKGIDFITGKIIRGEKVSDKVIGYVAYIEMHNGFNKTLYMTKEEMMAHAQKYSQSYAGDVKKGYKNSPWSTLFDQMATKTVLKLLISKYGIMSIDTESGDLAQAIAADGAAISKDGKLNYIDNQTIDAVDVEIAANANSEDFEPIADESEPPQAETANVTETATTAQSADNADLEGMNF